MSERLRSLTDSMHKCECKSCGWIGKFNNTTCSVCGMESERIKQLSLELEKLIDHKEIFSEEELFDLNN